MTDQRNRVTTDPGLGPVEIEHPSTLRSIAAADPVETDSAGAPVYYEPKLLNAVSDHKTLELETVKLARDIDPRKLPTELTLRRPVLHVVPASETSWAAPASPYDASWPGPQQFESGWPPPPQFDSSWPPPETVLTTSQPPQAPRRSLLPLLFVALLGAGLLLVLGARAMRRSATLPITAQRSELAPHAVAAAPNQLDARPRAADRLTNAKLLPDGAATTASVVTGTSTSAAVSASVPPLVGEAASAASARLADAPHHASNKPATPAIANGPASSVPVPAKPKRAIY